MSPTQVRIDYDDDPLAIIEKINTALKAYGLVLVDDAEFHDGYCLYAVKPISVLWDQHA